MGMRNKEWILTKTTDDHRKKEPYALLEKLEKMKACR